MLIRVIERYRVTFHPLFSALLCAQLATVFLQFDITHTHDPDNALIGLVASERTLQQGITGDSVSLHACLTRWQDL
jgi:hypothetical protein